MMEIVAGEAVLALFEVVMIDLVLAGDNAVVIGLAAAGLPAGQRRRAILIGIVAATVLRLAFAGVATQLLQIVGLLFAGGLLLLWVCWRMWRELREKSSSAAHSAPGADATASPHAHKSIGQATLQIVLADVSMSLDNVLAVAGAAREHPAVLIVGLVLSIALMGAAANVLGRLLQQYRWIAYVGLAIILYVACDMVYRGAIELHPILGRAIAPAA